MRDRIRNSFLVHCLGGVSFLFVPHPSLFLLWNFRRFCAGFFTLDGLASAENTAKSVY